MRRKILILGITLTLFMVGCRQTQSENKGDVEREVIVESTNYSKRLVRTGQDDLYYDKETKVVYYYFVKIDFGINGNVGYGFMSPFYSENGKLVRFNVEDKKFEEIID